MTTPSYVKTNFQREKKEQFKHVDSKFGTSSEGVINVNYEEIQEKQEPEEAEDKNEVSSFSKLRVEG